MIKLGLQYFSDEEDEFEIDNDQIEEEIRAALSNDDADLADELVEKYICNYDGDIEDEAFRWAIQEGCSDYVEAHADDIELNDVDAGCCSTYLDETDDPKMIELLMDLGACRSLEDYSDCAFAVDTVNSLIVAFKPEFQKIVFDKFLEAVGMTKEEVIEALENDEAADTELPEDFADADYETLAEVCELLKVSAEDGELVFEEFDELDDSVPGWVVREIIEKLGFETNYEGTANKFEELGVYFVK